jgi:hypothetical protein
VLGRLLVMPPPAFYVGTREGHGGRKTQGAPAAIQPHTLAAQPPQIMNATDRRPVRLLVS